MKDSIINHFGTGSQETLNISIDILRNKMIEFYNTYYCPDNICHTILSNKPINIIGDSIFSILGWLFARTVDYQGNKSGLYSLHIQ